MHDDLLEGAASAAEFTGLSRRKIYRLVEAGHLPVVRKGRSLFFRKSELKKAFAAASGRSGTPSAAMKKIMGMNVWVSREPMRRTQQMGLQ